jgi:LCP family protein required for cell wall assembly
VDTPTTTTTPWVARPSTGRTVAIVVLAAVMLGALIVGGAVLWLDRSVDRVGVDGLGERGGTTAGGGDPDAEGTDDDLDPRALTVLVLGSDSRDVLTAEERRELGTGYAEGERTEVIALTRLDPNADEVRVLSVPRDTLVERCDGTSGRVNAAFTIGENEGIGGATCVVETLRDWLGVRIDHAVKVDFRGFVDIVDAVGGVEMFIEEPMQDRRANLDLEAGCQRLDGADALAFVRARHLDDDFGRIERQQRFVTELRDELADQGVLSDLGRLLRVAEATARAVELDDTLTIGRIQQLVREHRSTLNGDIDSRSIPGQIERIDGLAFVRADEERASQLARWLVTGRDLAEVRESLEDDAGAEEAGGEPTAEDTADEGTAAPEDDASDGGASTATGDDRDPRASC